MNIDFCDHNVSPHVMPDILIRGLMLIADLRVAATKRLYKLESHIWTSLVLQLTCSWFCFPIANGLENLLITYQWNFHLEKYLMWIHNNIHRGWRNTELVQASVTIVTY